MTESLTALFNGLRPLWDMSVTAAWAAGLVLLMRLLLKNRAPRRFVCLLWLVVFARLLVPVSLESPVSLVPPVLSQNASVGRDGLIFDSVGDGRLPPANIAPGTPSSQPPQTENRRAESSRPTLTNGNASAGYNVSVPETSAFPWQALLAGVWLAGTVGMLGCGLVTYARLRRRVRLAVRVADRVWEDETVESPFILGLFNPRVYLPTGLEGRARRFILCHEFAHLRRLDHIVKPLCWFALALHWFNPAVWAAFLLLGRDMEGACDEAVLRTLGEDVKADYSCTLLALASGKHIPAPCPVAFDEGDAKGRIKSVLNYRRPALWIIVVSVVAVAAAAVCLLTDPVAEKPDDTNSPAPSVGPDAPIGPSESPNVSEPNTGRDEGIAPYGADPWMVEVLTGERTFYACDAQWDIAHLKEAYVGDQWPDRTVTLEKLAFLDLDGDGANEMVLFPVGDDEYLYSVVGYMILRLEGDTVHGYAPGWRSVGNLKADGTFYWSGGASYNGIGRARFEGGEFSLEQDTWVDNGSYFVEGQPATEEEYNAAIATQDAKPEPVWYTFNSGALWRIPTSIPLDSNALSAPVPDFLNLEQQDLYRQAYSLYSHLFGPATSAIDEWPNPEELPPAEPVEVDGYTYVPSTGLFANWDDLEAAALSVFTPAFWQARNTWLDNDGNPHQTFIYVDGRTYYLDGARGSFGTNPYFPDTFHLPEQGETEISFILTGHYSTVWPLEGESEEERDARLKANWETYIGFPMKLVMTENGWRFDEFHVASCDDALLPFANQAAPNPALTDDPQPEGGGIVGTAEG